ncbi:hypothetical protein BST61_g1625 [Cercospora zeina]
MLSARELADATKQLEDFRFQSDKHAQSQSKVLDQYRLLLTDYERLQSDLEEARMARDNYKQLVRGQDRDPFVLLLVDGDGYVFEDTLVAHGAEGGSNAANMLNEAIKLRLRALRLDHCRIMVRVYANLVGLSKALAFAKLCGPEKRSIAPFVANFNRSGDLYDIVDAGELKENADFKVRAVFRQFAESTQCKHIFFAACHDVGYVSELQPYMGNKSRITLIRNYAFHREFSKLNLPEEDLPGIFRDTPLTGVRTGNSVALKAITPPPIERSPGMISQNTPVEKTKKITCLFYQKGNCKNGSACKFKHVKDIIKAPAHAKIQMSNLAKSDHDFMTGNVNAVDMPEHTDAGTEAFAPAEFLPRELDLSPDRIALNHERHRLDPYTPSPTGEKRAEFEARVAQQKLCNSFHLSGYCSKDEKCPYDHSPVMPNVLECLKSMARRQSCPRQGKCRWANCTFGHICQQPHCGYRGGKAHCKFPRYLHALDLKVAEIVQGTGSQTGDSPASTGSSSPHSEFFPTDSDDDRGSHVKIT